MIEFALKIIGGLWRLLANPIAAAACMGFAVGMWGQVAFFTGATLRAERAALPAKLAEARAGGIRDQAAADRPVFAQWSKALAECRKQKLDMREAAGVAAARADLNVQRQASAAYRMGRATCGATDAPSNPDRPVAADPGGVRDDDFAAAFRSGAFTGAR